MSIEMLLTNAVDDKGTLGTAQKIGGGGGGGGGSDLYFVTITKGGGTYSANKTFAEIKAANDVGKTVIFGYGFAFAVAFIKSNMAVTNLAFIDAITPYELRLVMASNNTITATLKKLQEAETVTSVTGTTPTIEPQANTVYNCGELTSLTISNPPATGKYSIIFFSGATPTATVGIANFTAEANKRYKITVEDNYAAYDSWPYTPT